MVVLLIFFDTEQQEAIINCFKIYNIYHIFVIYVHGFCSYIFQNYSEKAVIFIKGNGALHLVTCQWCHIPLSSLVTITSGETLDATSKRMKGTNLLACHYCLCICDGALLFVVISNGVF